MKCLTAAGFGACLEKSNSARKKAEPIYAAYPE